jgi:hypothetical protein
LEENMIENKSLDKASQLEQGRNLARRLYDLKLSQLEKINGDQRKAFLADFPLLGEPEFDDVRRQVIEAKTAERIRVGWHTIPHDVTVLVFVLVTWLVNLQAGILAATASLVLLESIFQASFNPKLYPKLSLLVWLTYPAYLLLAWVLYNRHVEWYWILLAVAGAWIGIFLAGAVARSSTQLIVKAWQDASRGRSQSSTGHK